MDAYGVRRKDTTKGPPLRVLSLGMFGSTSRELQRHCRNVVLLTLC